MRLELFKKDYEGLLRNNRAFLMVIGVLAVVVLMQQWAIVTEKTRTVLVPPYIDKAVKIGYASADADYYEAWGLYVSELMGNLTPGDAPFVEKAMGKLFSSVSYEGVKSRIAQSAAEEANADATFAFEAKSVIWQGQTGTVFVHGMLRQVNGPGRTISATPYTFSMRVHIAAGRPVLDDFHSYVGSPHTIQWKLHHIVKKQGGAS